LNESQEDGWKGRPQRQRKEWPHDWWVATKEVEWTTIVATLALGLWPRQGLARVRAKREAWKCRRVWGNEPSHSQVRSHFGSWNFNELLNL
jgi:hypothetical protein